MMVGFGLMEEENRLQMMYNRIGTIVAMTHILLPFMILPLAEKFRLKYSELKNSGLDADMIFGKLVDYVGFQGTPQRKAAVLAILLYYFDTCDIFEDPTDEEVQS